MNEAVRKTKQFVTRTSGRRCMVLLMVCSLVFGLWRPTPVRAEEVHAKYTLEALAGSLGSDIEHLIAQPDLIVAGDSVSDWIAFLYGRMGYESAAEGYLRELETYVSDMYQKNGGLDSVRATEWQRISLVVTALGGDPEHFGTDAEGGNINLLKDGCYDFLAADSFDVQGLNAWIYALLALDAKDTQIPEDARYSREDIIRALIEAQEPDGGFGLVRGNSDVDITAMTIQALAPYIKENRTYEFDGSVRTAADVVELAVDWLSMMQLENGGFESCGTENTESCAQVIIALCAAGIDPATDERFVKDASCVDALYRNRLEDGTFAHIRGDGLDVMATYQALMAEVSMERLEDGKGSIFAFADKVFEEKESAEEEGQNTSGVSSTWILLAGAAVVIALIVLVLAVVFRKKK